MSDDGYTLAEALAAMMVLSLALGALWSGFGAFSAIQHRVGATLADAQLPRRARLSLQNLLASIDPISSEPERRFSGTEQQLQFACGASQDCRAEIASQAGRDRLQIFDGREQHSFALPGPATYAFAYIGDESQPRWPPVGRSEGRLRAVALRANVAGDTRPVLVVKLWRDEPADCVFDVVGQDCRS